MMEARPMNLYRITRLKCSTVGNKDRMYRLHARYIVKAAASKHEATLETTNAECQRRTELTCEVAL